MSFFKNIKTGLIVKARASSDSSKIHCTTADGRTFDEENKAFARKFEKTDLAAFPVEASSEDVALNSASSEPSSKTRRKGESANA